MNIELFSVNYRPCISRPPVSILCQSIDLDGEKLLWIDGVSLEAPVLAPISAVRGIEHLGSFAEFMAAHVAVAREVLLASQGRHAPMLLARAMLYMSRDASLTAEAALDLVKEEGMDLIEADIADSLAMARL